jgi:hypothetical protein
MLHAHATCVLNTTRINFPFFVPVITTRISFSNLPVGELLDALATVFPKKQTSVLTGWASLTTRGGENTRRSAGK